MCDIFLNILHPLIYIYIYIYVFDPLDVIRQLRDDDKFVYFPIPRIELFTQTTATVTCDPPSTKGTLSRCYGLTDISTRYERTQNALQLDI